MAKDYAKATFKSRRARRQRSRYGMFFLIFLSVFSFMAILTEWYMHPPGTPIFSKENAVSWISDLKSLLHKPKQQQTVALNQTLKTENVTQSEPEIRFDFYTELPKMQVTLPATEDQLNKNTPPLIKEVKPVETTTVAKPVATQNVIEATTEIANTANVRLATAKNPTKLAAKNDNVPQYVVQVGAYKKDSTASEMRVSILLAGFDVSVVKTNLGGQVVYRIQQGPYPTLAQAKSAQKKLQAKGYDGVVQKLS